MDWLNKLVLEGWSIPEYVNVGRAKEVIHSDIFGPDWIISFILPVKGSRIQLFDNNWLCKLTFATWLVRENNNDGLNWTNSLGIRQYNEHKVEHTMWVLDAWRMILAKLKENKYVFEELHNKAENQLFIAWFMKISPKRLKYCFR